MGSKGRLLTAISLAAMLACGCGSGSSTGFFGGGTNLNPGAGGNGGGGPLTLRFDNTALPAGIDSAHAVFRDINGQQIGEPVEVELTGNTFVFPTVPLNAVTVEVDYQQNGGFALFESAHRIGGTGIAARADFSSTSNPQLSPAQAARTQWSTSLGPAQFHVLATGNPGADQTPQDKVFKVKGVGYSPAPIGFSNQDGPGFGDLFWDGGEFISGNGNLLDWSRIWKRDLENIRNRFNAVRCYSLVAEHLNPAGQFQPNNPVVRTHTKFLDACWNDGNKPVYVLVGIPLPSDCFLTTGDVANRTNFERVLASTIAQTKNHPAVMGYTFFNEIGGAPEWGVNQASSDFYWGQIKKYSQQIKTGAPDKLCGFAYFDAPGNVDAANAAGYLTQYGGSIDFWGVNAFQATTLDGTLRPYRTLTTAKKPVLFTEFGVPATSHRDKSIASGAFPTQASVNSIYADDTTIGLAAGAMGRMLPVLLSDEIAAGLMYFEWNDEFWKQPNGVEGNTTHYTTTKGAQEGGQVADTSQMPNGFNDEEGFGLNAPSLNGRAVNDLFDPFNPNAATANNRPDNLAPRTALLNAVTNALAPLR